MLSTVHTVKALRQLVGEARKNGKRIAFVPTMGNLHDGHLALIDEAHKHGDMVIASIFVNPMQFGENEDLDAYPRTLEADQKGLEAHGCDLLFSPGVNEVYPAGTSQETRIEVPGLSALHCGASRPGHFTGVATVVSKLFNMVQPDVAIFGQKDFQQLAVIRKMVLDLCFPIDIIGVPTSREKSGLARSSRNGYLSEAERKQAAQIYHVMEFCSAQIIRHTGSLADIRQQAIQKLADLGFKLDYLNFAHPDTLELAQDGDKEIVILVAVWLGNTRLIDNMTISLH